MNSEWTTNQRKAINTVDKNLQIVACAGSGKTTTMVEHIMELLSKPEINPENIVAITYTEKAAASLKNKIFDEFYKKNNSFEGLANMYIGTIHGFCLNLLQEYTDEYKSFETLNDVQTKLFIKKNRRTIGIFDVDYHNQNGTTKKIANEKSGSTALASAINAYKAFLDIGREYGVEKLNSTLKSHIEKYEEALKTNNYFDFTSIIFNTLNIIKSRKLDKELSMIKYLIVDEYQDVNAAQEEIISYFYKLGTIICVVGDDDQTIYQWRGSNLSFIKEFGQRYDNVEKIDLDTNFRSSKGITEISKHVINQNDNRILKDMKSNENQKYEQGDIVTYEFENRSSEIDFIIKKIKQLIGIKYTKKGKTYKIESDDIVILVSSVKKVDELIKALEINKIDFIVEGTKNLFASKEIQVLCETLYVIFDSIDVKNWSQSYKDTLAQLSKQTEIIKHWQSITKISEEKIETAIKQLIKYTFETDSYEFTIQEALKRLFIDLELFYVKDEKILYNLGKFTEIVNDFEKIYLLMETPYRLTAFSTFLRNDAPNIYPEGWLSPNYKTIKCLRIMTFHQAKGLEYPVVFMPFLTKNSIFPLRKPGGLNVWGIINDQNIKDQYDDTEEGIRRVFYVGMTRSEKFLFLSRSDDGNNRTPAFPFSEAKHSPYKESQLFLEKEYERTEISKLSQDEVFTLNFSLLKDLFDCPYKFKMNNIFGFISPLNIRMGYGKSIHNMLDYLHKNYKKIDYKNPDVIDSIVKRYLFLPYASPKLITAMTEKAKKNLISYIRKNSAKFEFIKYSEKGIDYKLDDYMFINGRIDLVRDEINHTITLVDFKSSSEVLSKEQIKNQLMVYVLGYENLTGEKVDYIESYDFNNSNPVTVELNKSDREAFRLSLVECEKRIRNSDFPKRKDTVPKNNKAFCKNIQCEYYDSCYNSKG